jgi:hypothetical protein
LSGFCVIPILVLVLGLSSGTKKKKGAQKFVYSNKKSQKVYSSLSRSATFIPMSVVTDTGRILSAAGCVLRRLFDWFISTYLMNNE